MYLAVFPPAIPLPVREETCPPPLANAKEAAITSAVTINITLFILFLSLVKNYTLMQRKNASKIRKRITIKIHGTRIPQPQ
jgi:hypothetical protein